MMFSLVYYVGVVLSKTCESIGIIFFNLRRFSTENRAKRLVLHCFLCSIKLAHIYLSIDYGNWYLV